jgi:hypothetical protein
MLTRAAIGAAVVSVVVGSFVTSLNHAESGGPGPTPAGSVGVRANAVPARAALARATLRRQQHALLASSRRDYLATWSANSTKGRSEAATVYANLKALGATITNLRYSPGSVMASSSAGRLASRDASRWTAKVQVTWRLPGSDQRAARSALAFTFEHHASTAYVAAIAAAGSTEPVWLLDRLRVLRSRHSMAVAATDRDAARLGQLLRHAVTRLRNVLPTWHGSLVAYQPPSSADLAATLGASAGHYDGIAAVTASVDGSTGKRAPVAIVVNPAVFDRLSARGAAVVVTHEAAHAATGAASVPLPLWVAEGFADYLGIGSVDVPLSVSAGALIRDLRHHGLPQSLPDDRAFAAAGKRLEVSYEQAWLAFRVIARVYGRARLVAFYDAVVDAPSAVNAALRTQLGTTRIALTRRWRAYLRAIEHAS